jgi:hypothetical protein
MKNAIAAGLILTVAACAQPAAVRTSGVRNSPIARATTGLTEIAKASAGPSAVQIYGNPRKWTGSYVRLNCEIIKVSRVPAFATSTADARCGRGVVASLADYPSRAATTEYNRELRDQALLALIGDKVSNLGAGQNVRIVGRVTGASPRKNGAGATINVVGIRVDYIQLQAL